MKLFFTSLILVFFISIQTVHSQNKTLDLDQIMSLTEQSEIGISKLSKSEKTALEEWLTKFAIKIYQEAKKESSGTVQTNNSNIYSNAGSGHWISKNIDSGKYIKLEDGSLWEVMSIDHIYSSLWLPISEITVIEASQPVGNYKYVLINTDDGEKVYARLVSN